VAAVVDLCNRSLSLLGAGSIASLTEASTEAVACRRWWDSVRQQVLRAAFWNSTRRLAELNLRSEELGQWTYTYTYPPDCLHARFIDATDGKFPPFVVASVEVTGGVDKVILTNAESAKLWYTADSEDPSEWDPLLEQAIVDALAGNMAVELTGKRSYRVDLFQKANSTIMSARSAAALEMRLDPSWKPGKLEAMDDWTDLSYDASPFVVPDGPLFV